MRALGYKFNEIDTLGSANKAGAKSYPPPFSIRLTSEERARLDADRGRVSVAAHTRERLFGDDAAPRKKPGNSPIKDGEALGRVLGPLGGSRLFSNLNQLAKAVNTGSLPVSPEVEAELMEACRATNKVRIRVNQDENAGVASRREGVARLERHHPRVSPQLKRFQKKWDAVFRSGNAKTIT